MKCCSSSILIPIFVYYSYAGFPPPHPAKPQPTSQVDSYQPPINQQCPPGQVLVTYSVKGVTRGSLCTIECESDSDCPPPVEGNAKPYCIYGIEWNHCALGCDYGHLSCPEYLGCELNTNIDRSACYSPL